MGILDIFRPRETRATTARSDDPYLAQWFGMRGIGATAVSPDNVLSNLAVAARCVGLRSEMLASVGLHVYRRTYNGGRERADDNPLYGVLHDNFNPGLSAFEGRELLIRDLDLSGNAFARIERNGRGQVVALFPLLAGSVGVERMPTGRLRYRVHDPRGASMVLLQEEVLHVRGPTRDGVMGLSPLTIARGAMAGALAQRETALALQENGLRPGMLVSYPQPIGGEKMQSILANLRETLAGPSNAGKVMVTDGGAKVEHLAWSPEDAEFLSTLKLSNEDVARVFGIPPTVVGITDRATYSNTEQEATALVRNALGPLAARVEAAMMRCLLTDQGRRTLYVEHNLETLLRGDVQARFESYRIAREIGALSANDVRRRENEPPIAGGDTYHQPANWVPLGTVPTEGGV